MSCFSNCTVIRASVDAVVRSMRFIVPSPVWASPLRHCFRLVAVAGDRYAQYHAEFANAARVRFERLLPPDNLDWNDVLKKGKGVMKPAHASEALPSRRRECPENGDHAALAARLFWLA